ncbi:Uncharacterised protein [Candidatus Gugararchaeum adminiculabundum]|nr:Uncharacterised protein [Candidatus Gugararchaeum adminiculabundum]
MELSPKKLFVIFALFSLIFASGCSTGVNGERTKQDFYSFDTGANAGEAAGTGTTAETCAAPTETPPPDVCSSYSSLLGRASMNFQGMDYVDQTVYHVQIDDPSGASSESITQQVITYTSINGMKSLTTLPSGTYEVYYDPLTYAPDALSCDETTGATVTDGGDVFICGPGNSWVSNPNIANDVVNGATGWKNNNLVPVGFKEYGPQLGDLGRSSDAPTCNTLDGNNGKYCTHCIGTACAPCAKDSPPFNSLKCASECVDFYGSALYSGQDEQDLGVAKETEKATIYTGGPVQVKDWYQAEFSKTTANGGTITMTSDSNYTMQETPIPEDFFKPEKSKCGGVPMKCTLICESSGMKCGYT